MRPSRFYVVEFYDEHAKSWCTHPDFKPAITEVEAMDLLQTAYHRKPHLQFRWRMWEPTQTMLFFDPEKDLKEQ